MKTQIVTIFTALVLAAGIANTTKAATIAKNGNVTILNNVAAINKIEVHGNVELFISDGETDQVNVSNRYYAESALVQSSNGTLRITSYNAEKLVIWVKASDLRAVSAYDNAQVKTFGSVSKIEFNVDLHNNATAKLSIDAFAANVTVNDHAKADLNGTVTEFSLVQSIGSTINKTGLNATHTVQNKAIIPVDADNDDLATL